MTTPPTSIAFGVGTFNVQNLKDLTRENVRKCAGIVSKQAGLVGFQEIAEKQDDADIEAILKPLNWHHRHPNSENKISAKRSIFKPTPEDKLPEGWKQSGMEDLSKGVARLTPKRDVTWDILSFVANPDLSPFLFADFHMVSGVGNKDKDRQAERRALRAEEKKNLVAFFAKAHNAGLNVIWVADTNWRLMPKMHPAEVSFVNSTIDKIRFIPAPQANWDLTCKSVERHGNPSDHDFFVANVLARANANYKVSVPMPPSIEQQFQVWVKKNHVSPFGEKELRKILNEV